MKTKSHMELLIVQVSSALFPNILSKHPQSSFKPIQNISDNKMCQDILGRKLLGKDHWYIWHIGRF
jgi:hypothetical protein